MDEEKKKLSHLHQDLRGDIRERWDRVLPFGEQISDRWEKAKYLGFGEGSSIYDSSYVFGKVEVGKNTWVGPNTLLDGSGGLKIGDNCSISAGTQIYSHDSVKWALSGGKNGYDHQPVEIGDNCFIGANVVILKGVKIGRTSVIGANSLVTEDIPENSVAFGNPATIKGKVKVEDGEIELIYC